MKLKALQRIAADSHKSADDRGTAADAITRFFLSPENRVISIQMAPSLFLEISLIASLGPTAAFREKLVHALAQLGLLMSSDWRMFVDWIGASLDYTLQPQPSEGQRMVAMDVMVEAVRLDSLGALGPRVQDFTMFLLNHFRSMPNQASPAACLRAYVRMMRLRTEVVSKSFQDMVLLMVSWFTDPAISVQTINVLATTIIDLSPSFRTNDEFSVGMLQSLAADAQQAIAAINAGAQRLDTALDGILRCYSVIMAALGSQSLKSIPGFSLVFQGLMDCLPGLVNLGMYGSFELSPGTVQASMNAMVLACSVLRSRAATSVTVMLEFLLTQIGPLTSDMQVVAWLAHMKRLILVLESPPPTTFVWALLKADSTFLALRHRTDIGVVAGIMTVVRTLLDNKNAELQQYTYAMMVEDAYRAAKRIANNADNGLAADDISILVLDILALGAVVDPAAGCNTIGIRQLKPSLIELIQQPYPFGLQPEVLPESVTLALLSLASRYSRISGFFISSGNLLSAFATRDRDELVGIGSRMLGLLGNGSRRTVIQALRWISEFATSAQQRKSNNEQLGMDSNVEDLVSQLANSVSKLATARRIDVRCAAGNCLQALMCSGLLNEADGTHVVSVGLRRTADTDPAVQQAFVAALSSAPVTAVPAPTATNETPVDNVRHRRITTQITPPGVFRAHQFHESMTHLCGLGDRPSTPAKKEPTEWLSRMLTTSRMVDNLSNRKGEANLADANEIRSSNSLAAFWSTAECAKFCVLARLKTPLGAPKQLFEMIDKAIRRFAVTVTPPADPRAKESESTITDQSKQANALLLFLFHLERHLFNATEGCISLSSVASLNSRVFFAKRQNRLVCESWFGSVRSEVIMATRTAGSMSGGVWHGIKRLRHLFVSLKEATNKGLAAVKLWDIASQVEKVVVYTVDALVQMRQPVMIAGIATWARRQTPKEIVHHLDGGKRWLGWLGATQWHARGNLERAAIDYEEGLRDYVAFTQKRTAALVGGGHASADAEVFAADAIVLEYLASQSIRCYTDLSDWSGVDKLNVRLEGSGQSVEHLVDIDMVAALGHFDGGNITGAAAALERIDLELQLPNTSTRCGALHLLTHKADYHTVSGLLATAEGKAGRPETAEYVRTEFTKAKQHIHAALQMTQMESSSLATRSVLLLLQTIYVAGIAVPTTATSAGETIKQPRRTLPSVLDPEVVKLDPALHSVSSWTRLMRVVDFVHEHHGEQAIPTNVQEAVRLTFVRLARKQGNLGLAQRLVEASANPGSKDVVYAASKLAFAQGNYRGAVQQLWDAFMKVDAKGPVDGRALLRLAAWFQTDEVGRDSEFLASLSGAGLKQGAALLPDVLARLRGAGGNSGGGGGGSGSVAFRLAGSCLSLATFRTPEHAKAHARFGAWCYRQGRLMIALRTSDDFPTEMAEQITTLVESWEQEHGSGSGGAITSVMNLFIDTLVAEDTTILLNEDEDHSDPQTRFRAVRRSVVEVLPGVSEAIADGLMKLWSETQAQVLQLYTCAATAYFTYLRLDAGISDVDDNNITATLRLLRLLVRHGVEMQDVLTREFATSPSFAWQRIVPQLFARLSHPSTYVQEQVQSLLNRIAQDAPHLIVYPAVVGAEDDENGSEDDSTVRTSPTSESPSAAKAAFRAIKQSLQLHSPELVEQVHGFISELKRITVLWDEAWISWLGQRQGDITRRLQRLKSEGARVAQNETLDSSEKRRLILEKHSAIMKPVLVDVDDLRRRTYARTSESPHEKQFARMFGSSIDAAIAELREPSCIPYDAAATWAPFKLLDEQLKEVSRRKLVLEDISPRLAARQASAISMPGLSARDPAKLVTIQSFKKDVLILPSKTKPKKLFLVGSDGKEYAFLFKGHEDLHLDERIMQFLDIVNLTFNRAAKTRSKFRARSYDVIPTGAQSGLIQWVDGTVPAFSLYSKWQHRKFVQSTELAASETAAQQQQEGSNSGKVANAQASKVTVLPRPSELFFKKLTPALRERGITNLVARTKWPRDVLTQVLEELHKETPSDLISRELWMASSSPAEWIELTNNYARSMAVNSMIGHILGLGDRHLDNILMDFSTGEVVHIDYNVCFEKGTKLRVPEVVPYRMSANFRKALGVTGIEGEFRTSCEHVLRSLRRNREILLTLLEAFVYDPLVDWTPDDESDQERKAMERNISHTLLGSRITELKVPLQLNQSKLNWAFAVYQEALDQLVAGNRALVAVQQQAVGLQTETELLYQLSDADANRILPQLFDVYAREHVLQTHCDVVSAAINKVCYETGAWHEQHLAATDAIRGQHLTMLQSQLMDSQTETLAVATDNFGVATEYLMGAGQSKLQRQCQDAHYQLTRVSQQRRAAMLSCMQQLQKYSMIAAEYPRSVVFQNRCFLWHEWLQKLINDPSLQTCSDVLNASMYRPPSQDQVKACRQMEDVLSAIVLSRRNAIADLKEGCTAEPGTKGAWMVEDRVAESTEVINKFCKGTPGEFDCVLVKLMQQRLWKLRQLEDTMGNDSGRSGGLDEYRASDMSFSTGSAYKDNAEYILERLVGEADRAGVQIEMLRGCYSTIGETGEFDHPDCVVALVCFAAAQTLFQQLQTLLTGFTNVMLPDIIKSLQSDYVAVSSAIDKVGEMCEEAKELHDQLEIGVSGQDATAVAEGIHRLRTEFRQLCNSGGDQGTFQGPGQVLIARFNNLFEEPEKALEDLYAESSNSKAFPFAWAGLVPDLPTKSASKMGKASDLFFVKRLMAMQSCFAACQEYAYAYTQDYTAQHVAPLDAEAEAGLKSFENVVDGVGSPDLRRYVAEFCTQRVKHGLSSILGAVVGSRLQALGLISKGLAAQAWAASEDDGADGRRQGTSAESLVARGIAACVEAGRLGVRPDRLPTAQRYLENLVNALESSASLQREHAELATGESIRQWAQLQLARFQWLHSEVLARHPQARSPMVPTLTRTISDIFKGTQELIALQQTFRTCSDNLLEAETDVLRRVAWGKNANRSLEHAHNLVGSGLAQRQQAVAAENKTCGAIIGVCNAISHMEMFRARNQETDRFDGTNGRQLQAYYEVLKQVDQVKTSVQRHEEELPPGLKEFAPQGHITLRWVDRRRSEVGHYAATAVAELDRLAAGQLELKEQLIAATTTLKETTADTEALLAELMPLLKPVIAAGDATAKAVQEGYQSFGETVEMLADAGLVLAEVGGGQQELELLAPDPEAEVEAEGEEEMDDARVGPTGVGTGTGTSTQPAVHTMAVRLLEGDVVLGDLCASLEQVHDQLMALQSATAAMDDDEGATEQQPADSGAGSNARTRQEKNAHAVAVWKRVRAKLEGRGNSSSGGSGGIGGSKSDSNGQRHMSVAEQVEKTIREATSNENLSVMFEGWTAWI
jgi:PI-3-kinase-related kinase SMG-1